MPALHVVAAVIVSTESGQKRIFATQRGYGEFKDGWEFPGLTFCAFYVIFELLNCIFRLGKGGTL